MKGPRRAGTGAGRRLGIGSKLRRALARNQRIAAELTRVLDAARRGEGPPAKGLPAKKGPGAGGRKPEE